MSAVLDLKPGERVNHKNKTYRILKVLDLKSLIAEDVVNGDKARLPIAELENPPVEDAQQSRIADLVTINDEDWNIAQERYAIILPLLNTKTTKTMIQERADKAGVHISTIYRWIKAFESTGVVSSLLSGKSEGGRGESRVDELVETIIQSVIDEKYMNTQKLSITKTHKEIKALCRKAGLSIPSPNTVRSRIMLKGEREKLAKRHGADRAEQKFEPHKGSFPGADYPLAVVQIDHTVVDLILVDDIDRLPVGRPWITVAIDVFSRMVAGFHVSFDPPGTMSVGLCLAHAILGKETWLAKLGIESEWPLWGLPAKIHADNAKEFRGNMLKRACKEYGMDLEWRPVKKPRYGAHIERLLGTFNEDIHTLPGTTFSNVEEKGDYDSEGKSIMTLSDFERWLGNLITGVYHEDRHSGIGTSPLKKYEEGIFGNKDQPGSGLPARIQDEERLRLDLMPFWERTVQKYGIILDDVQYYHDVLRPWVNCSDPETGKKKKFLIRRDSRDISAIYFFDPELKQYFEIPYRNPARPAISVWELKAAKRRLKNEGENAINEDRIFDAYERMRELEQNASKETKKVRRANQRRRMNEDARKEKGKWSSVRPEVVDVEPIEDVGEEYEPFGDGDY